MKELLLLKKFIRGIKFSAIKTKTKQIVEYKKKLIQPRNIPFFKKGIHNVTLQYINYYC